MKLAFRLPFAAFRADPEWQKARAASEVNGKIVQKVESVFLSAGRLFKTQGT